MSWVAVGTTVVSAASAAYGASKSASATKKAGQLAQKGADAATQAQQDQYYQTREDFAPFRTPANRALATLQSALYGGPVAYDDPSTTALTEDELAAENWNALRASGLGNPGNGLGDGGATAGADSLGLGADFWKDVNAGEDPSSRLARGITRGDYAGLLPYDSGKKWYRGADGKLTTTAPARLTATWKPQESEGFKYTKSRTLEDLGRSLRMMGRGSGTVAANATGRTLGDLNANNEATQRNELWNLVKTGEGAAGSVQSAGTNMANNLSGNAMATGNTLAQLAMDRGQTQANLWGGLGGTAMNAYGAYQMGKYFDNQKQTPAPVTGDTYFPGYGYQHQGG